MMAVKWAVMTVSSGVAKLVVRRVPSWVALMAVRMVDSSVE